MACPLLLAVLTHLLAPQRDMCKPSNLNAVWLGFALMTTSAPYAQSMCRCLIVGPQAHRLRACIGRIEPAQHDQPIP